MHSDSSHAHDTKSRHEQVTDVITVVIDLTYECIMRFSTFVVIATIQKFRAEEPHQLHHSVEHEIKEAEHVEEEVVTEAVPTFRTVQEVLSSGKEEKISESLMGSHTIVYVANISAPLYKNPTMEFDTRIGTIPYGEMAMMLEPRGRFLKVAWNTLEGWVLREDVVDRAAHIYPEFVVGEENSVDHPNTAHVRAILGDVFGIGHSEFALQAGEYVLYKLWRKNIRIEWPSVRPRVPGLWHKILRGIPHIQMSVTPKVGSVMEYMLTNDMGHVAYVEAVFPDNTIALSEANYPDSGIYSERQLTKEEWKELRPVFIQLQ